MLRAPSSHWRLCAAFLFVCALPLSGEDNKPKVIGMVGRWKLLGSNEKSVTLGMSVDLSDRIVRDGPNKNFGSITIWAQGRPVSITCDEKKPCILPIDLSDAGDKQTSNGSPPTSFIAHLIEKFSANADRYYSALSRDYGTIQDAVVELRGGGLYLKPALGALNPGEYRLRLTNLSSGAPSSSVSPLTFTWNPEANMPVAVPLSKPGLHEMRVEAKGGETVGTAWILCAASAQFARQSAEFEAVKKTTDAWPPSVPADSIQAIRRAALEQLAQ